MSLCFLGFDEQEGTVADDFINECSRTADGNVVLSGTTEGDWEMEASGAITIMAVKLDVTDGTVIWRYQVRTATVVLCWYWKRRELSCFFRPVDKPQHLRVLYSISFRHLLPDQQRVSSDAVIF